MKKLMNIAVCAGACIAALTALFGGPFLRSLKPVSLEWRFVGYIMQIVSSLSFFILAAIVAIALHLRSAILQNTLPYLDRGKLDYMHHVQDYGTTQKNMGKLLMLFAVVAYLASNIFLVFSRGQAVVHAINEFLGIAAFFVLVYGFSVWSRGKEFCPSA